MTLRGSHDKPVYIRISEVIADAILAGRYGDGDPLPSVRALAAEEGANPLTVAKAYQGFQDAGLIVVKRGVGLFVAPGARSKLRATERDELPQGRMARDPRAHDAIGDRPRAPDVGRNRLGLPGAGIAPCPIYRATPCYG